VNIQSHGLTAMQRGHFEPTQWLFEAPLLLGDYRQAQPK
jgi:hypothetical protein